ncbi:MAG TPA: fructose-bisphosphatase class III [Armatimonadota bacterium]|nr:fructose-bisphosphatase class III [Armatimonadota bacterium]
MPGELLDEVGSCRTRSDRPERSAHDFDGWELTALQSLAAQFPTTNTALAEIAALEAVLSLPCPVVHVISDIHGDYKKLRHVINNASGSLRPLVEALFAHRLDEGEMRDFLAILYYPHEAIQHLSQRFTSIEERRRWVLCILRRQFEVIRKLAANYRHGRVVQTFPPEMSELFEELLYEPCVARSEAYIQSIVSSLDAEDRDFAAVRDASHVIRNLSVSEIFVAGDMGDRGLRIDQVIDYLMRQPKVAITWGNHDTYWMGACLGQEACIATALRMSLRYRRLSQLEEGYGIITSPLEKLARTVYGEDPSEHFKTKGVGLRDDVLMARMQKAAAIIQFKLEGQTSRRHPDWDYEHRNLLHRIDHAAGTVEIDGTVYPMLDMYLPTIDPADPYALSSDEQSCMDRIRRSFVTSPRLWQQMLFMVSRGSMWSARRSHNVLIFHACVPVDSDGSFLSMKVDGVERKGRDLFDSIGSLIHRTVRKGADALNADADWLWYLWAGERSPLFGKDKMATFETYFVADSATRVETKNPYFQLIHDADFCRRILREFGVPEEGLIVNGHVPVKIEKGEQPVKKGGNCVTIDGAFSEAYGDKGYTLVLSPDRITLAEHYHFESVEEAIQTGADIVPKIMTLRSYAQPRTMADSQDGETMKAKIEMLCQLVRAYQEGVLIEQARAES